MNRKFLGILVVVAGFFILAGIVYVIFLGKFSFSDIFGKSNVPEVATSTPVVTSPVKTKTSVMEAVIRERQATEGNNVTPIEPIKRNDIKAFNKDDLMRMAASFAERFGSYSNHSNFSNVVDLKVFMSTKMQKWADNFVYEQLKKGISEAAYFGVTSKAIGKEVKTFDDNVGVASVLVMTRRREYIGTTVNLSNTYDQDILINFVNENGAWKIDTADWQSKK